MSALPATTLFDGEFEKTVLLERIRQKNFPFDYPGRPFIETKTGEEEGFNTPKPGDVLKKLYAVTSIEPANETILADLLQEALANGIAADHQKQIASRKPGLGSTSEFVFLSNAEIYFATKIDNSRKLVAEATILQLLALRTDLPKDFANLFPKVYAVKSDAPPYGYTMEAFRLEALANLIYIERRPADTIKKILDHVLPLLFNAYQMSLSRVLRPNTSGLYLQRITERLAQARQLHPGFKQLSTSPIKINGIAYKTPEEYLALITQNLHLFESPFVSFVHGDAHPENILVKIENELVTARFIDPKDWYQGDYMFDIGKLCHYLLVAGPLEKVKPTPKPGLDMQNLSLSYDLSLGEEDRAYSELVLHYVQSFAKQNSDSCHEKRYLLSMASNLLGMPFNRLEKNQADNAFILYAEGLRYLELCTHQ